MEQSFQEYLRNSLHRLFPNSKDDGAKNNVLINCPLCIKEGRPDSKHHMSVCLGNDGKPLFYNCFRNTSHRGILTSQSLLELAWDSPIAVDPLLLEALDNYNKQNNRYSRYKFKSHQNFNIDSSYMSNSELNEMKRKYICERIGFDLPFEELAKNKIIFSIKELLWRNYINQYTRDERIVEQLDKYFVGFLSNNNGSIAMRNTVYGKIDLGEFLNFRYIKYSVVQGAPAGYYIIPSVCDVTKRIEVVIAEGQFDILSIFYNLYNGERYNRVYSSIGGNGYLNIIQYFLCDIGLVDPIFHIYIDNDIKKFVLHQIEKIIKPLGINIYIHMNTYEKEKDFGVPKSRIKEYIYKL